VRQLARTRKRAWILSGGLAFVTAIALVYHLTAGTGATTAQRQAGIEAPEIASDLDSHQLYLGARTHWRAYRSRPGDTVGILEQAVARDPDYAPAWALLALAHASGLFNVASSFDIPIQESRSVVNTVLSKAEEAARRAIDLDDGLADAYASLAFIEEKRGQHLPAEELYLKALALDPNHPDALHLYSGLLAGVGRLHDAAAMRQRLLTLEPFVPVYNQHTGWVLWLNGRDDAALAIYKAMAPADRGPLLANLYASQGRYGDALSDLTSRNPNSGTASVLRMAPAKAASPQTLPRLDLTSFAYLYVGAYDRFLEPIERQIDAGYSDPLRNAEVWHPSPPYAAVRKTERFKAYARNAGLVDYWRVKGWPEFCRPVGVDDFICY
jgi:tetratricopeptide (TPR) repeat protein